MKGTAWHTMLTENLRLMQQWDEMNKPDFFSYEKELLIARLQDWQREIVASNVQPGAVREVQLEIEIGQ